MLPMNGAKLPRNTQTKQRRMFMHKFAKTLIITGGAFNRFLRARRACRDRCVRRVRALAVARRRGEPRRKRKF